MRVSRLLSLVLAATLLTACGRAGLPTAPVRADATAMGARTVPGKLIVRWKRPGVAATVFSRLGLSGRVATELLNDDAATFAKPPNGAAADGRMGIELLNDAATFVKLPGGSAGRVNAELLNDAATFGAAPSGAVGTGVAPAAPTGSVEVLTLPTGVDLATFRAAAGDNLAWAEPDYILRLSQPAPEAEEATNGLEVAAKAKKKATKANQWAPGKIHLDAAWRVTRGAANVRIAIIDTGADLGHPDLAGQVVDSYRAAGWLGRLGLSGARDDNGHGTHCAGIVGALAGNDDGVTGIAPGCKLMVAKVLDADGAGATSDIVRGIRWAIAGGANVLSLSFGSPDESNALREAIQDAQKAGIVVVAAMGNEGKQVKNYPAAYPGVIAVAATTSSDKVASYSTRGAWVSVAAPGSDILSTTPTYAVTLGKGKDAEIGLNYGVLSGTSMATPLVAGLAGLLLSRNSKLTPTQVKSALERSTVALADGSATKSGRGRVDAGTLFGGR